MNIFAPIFTIGGKDFPIGYFDIFQEVLFLSEDEISGFFKIVAMSPTGILAILTVLHIMEPKSEYITRNYLATASIIGFIIYLLIYGLMYAAVSIATDLGDILFTFFDSSHQKSEKPGALDFGIYALLYPLLFLSYVLVHRFMSYDKPEHHQNINKEVQPSIPARPFRDYDESELV